jgi:hypothetical protein
MIYLAYLVVIAMPLMALLWLAWIALLSKTMDWSQNLTFVEGTYLEIGRWIKRRQRRSKRKHT